MQQKVLLLASFLREEQIDTFLKKLDDKFDIKKENIFFFKQGDEFILTYRLYLSYGDRIDIKKDLNKTVQIHKKGDTIFTINALNKLIEQESGTMNINHKDYKINWDLYKNKIILLKDNKLDISSIERIFI
jgi:hypothetical protein